MTYVYILVGVQKDGTVTNLRYYLRYEAAEHALHKLEDQQDPDYDPQQFKDVYIDHIEVME